MCIAKPAMLKSISWPTASNVRQITQASFRVTGMQAEWWDPMSGQITPAQQFLHRKERNIRGSGTGTLWQPVSGLFTNARLKSPPEASRTSEPASLDLSEGWRVTFGTARESKTMEHLNSWIDDEATRYFSGVAVYEKTISVPENMLQPGTALQLDFGEGTGHCRRSRADRTACRPGSKARCGKRP